MQIICCETQHEGLSKYIDWMFSNQKIVYTELCAAVGEIPDAECKARVEKWVIQNQLIIASLNIVHVFVQKGDDPTGLAFQLSQIFRPTSTTEV